jgi:predicted alpha/beta-fold hydrolase
LRRFDDLYTAPRGGFADALDYYRRSSSLPVISEIKVPALILAARDDPFIALEPFEQLVLPANVSLRVAANGGHLGFLGWEGRGIIRWAERQAADWISNHRLVP